MKDNLKILKWNISATIEQIFLQCFRWAQGKIILEIQNVTYVANLSTQMLILKCIWMNTRNLKCLNVICAKKHFIWNGDWENTSMDTGKKQIKFCHFFNNQVECPFEENGCMFTHSVSPQCKFKDSCLNSIQTWQVYFCNSINSSRWCIQTCD